VRCTCCGSCAPAAGTGREQGIAGGTSYVQAGTYCSVSRRRWWRACPARCARLTLSAVPAVRTKLGLVRPSTERVSSRPPGRTDAELAIRASRRCPRPTSRTCDTPSAACCQRRPTRWQRSRSTPEQESLEQLRHDRNIWDDSPIQLTRVADAGRTRSPSRVPTSRSGPGRSVSFALSRCETRPDRARGGQSHEAPQLFLVDDRLDFFDHLSRNVAKNGLLGPSQCTGELSRKPSPSRFLQEMALRA